MFQPNAVEPRFEEESLDAQPSRRPSVSRQRQLMLGSLVLLLIALGTLLYNDRDFWFPDAQDAEDSLTGPATDGATQRPAATTARAAHAAAKRPIASAHTKDSPTAVTGGFAVADSGTPDPPPVTAVRTVLPPLQVEVVAGDVHHTVRPGANSVHVDLQPGGDAKTLVDLPPPSGTADTAATLTTSAAENVQLSASASEVVSHSVTPGYPLLARQMKVQGSVILQALINRDGSIQELHILSGPPILAGAAREAVRQWHFKPHYEGAESVETLAKITVNFTISTN
jgi:TonB family protein